MKLLEVKDCLEKYIKNELELDPNTLLEDKFIQVDTDFSLARNNLSVCFVVQYFESGFFVVDFIFDKINNRKDFILTKNALTDEILFKVYVDDEDYLHFQFTQYNCDNLDKLIKIVKSLLNMILDPDDYCINLILETYLLNN